MLGKNGVTDHLQQKTRSIPNRFKILESSLYFFVSDRAFNKCVNPMILINFDDHSFHYVKHNNITTKISEITSDHAESHSTIIQCKWKLN